jgi:hypothetical protein
VSKLADTSMHTLAHRLLATSSLTLVVGSLTRTRMHLLGTVILGLIKNAQVTLVILLNCQLANRPESNFTNSEAGTYNQILGNLANIRNQPIE